MAALIIDPSIIQKAPDTDEKCDTLGADTFFSTPLTP